MSETADLEHQLDTATENVARGDRLLALSDASQAEDAVRALELAEQAATRGPASTRTCR